MDTHTPTPWHVAQDMGRLEVVIAGPDRRIHARCAGEADAALIVRAVNRDHLFEEMVAFVERAACRDYRKPADVDVRCLEPLVGEARALLAKVRP